MASNIKTANINTNYPIAGENNDTKGFRDNFSEIKNNLDVAEAEITNLQNNTAKIDQSSDFFGNKIINAEVDQSTQSFYDLGNTDIDQIIDFSNGHYQTVAVGDNIILTLDGWPAEERYAKITVSLTTTGSAYNVDWVTLKNNNPGIIKKNQGNSFLLSDSTEITVGRFPNPFIVDSETDPVVVEFWTVDGGETVHANYLGKFA